MAPHRHSVRVPVPRSVVNCLVPGSGGARLDLLGVILASTPLSDFVGLLASELSASEKKL